MTTATPTAFEPRERPRALSWIAGPALDLPWILLCPLVALVVMEGLWRSERFSDDAIYSTVFAFIVTGHHMPGWLRAFFEPAVYRRHKARLWTSAVAIPAMILLPAAYGIGVIVAPVAALFDLWHTALQQHGFGRIYSGKAGDIDRGAAKLELACVLTWYGTVVAWSDAWSMGIATAIHAAGLDVFDGLTPAAWHGFKTALSLLSAALFVAYARHAFRLFRARGIVAVQKHVLHVVMFGVALYAYRAGSWYRAQSVQNLFHALQYIAMVWVFGHLGIRRRSTEPGAAYRGLFEARWSVVPFVVLVLAYGGASLYWPGLFSFMKGGAPRHAEMASSLGFASLFLHFYVDSFIWKVRDDDVRKALAIASVDGSPAASATPAREHLRGVGHALLYFGLPILLVALLGARLRASTPEREEAFAVRAAALFPRSAVAAEGRGAFALAHGDVATARASFERAYELAPTLDGPAVDLAQVDRIEGRPRDAVVHLEAARRARPRDTGLRLALGSALAATGDFERAEVELRAAIEAAPTRVEPRLELGALLRHEGRVDEAIVELRHAVAMAPDSGEAKAELAAALASKRAK